MADDIITIDLAETTRYLRDVADNLSGTRGLMRDLAEVLLTGVEEAFLQQEGPGGTPWKDLAASTIEERKAAGTWPGQILQRTGQLAASLQPFSSSTAAGVTTNHPGAALQNFGGTSDMPPGPAAVPARPFLYISDQTEKEINATLDDYADDAIGR